MIVQNSKKLRKIGVFRMYLNFELLPVFETSQFAWHAMNRIYVYHKCAGYAINVALHFSVFVKWFHLFNAQFYRT